MQNATVAECGVAHVVLGAVGGVETVVSAHGLLLDDSDHFLSWDSSVEQAVDNFMFLWFFREVVNKDDVLIFLKRFFQF